MRWTRKLRGPLAASLLAAAGCSDTLPPNAQVVLYVTTDAPLPPAPGATLGELEPTPLFDTLRFDVYLAGQDEPCDGCTHSFAVDRAMIAEGRASIGVPAAQPLAEQRVRVRLFSSAAELGEEPSWSGSIDVITRIPALDVGEVEPIHIVLRTDDVGAPVGSLAAPLDPSPGLPDPAIVGSWEGATRVDCPEEPGPGEVCVPGGAFWMGDVSQLLPLDPEARADERRIVVLSPFYVDATEVTVSDLIEGDGYRAGDPHDTENRRDFDARCTFPGDPTAPLDPERADLPVSCVTFYTAAEYCASRGGSLPTEAELEYLMSGLRDARFPWGDDLPSCADATFARYQANEPGVPTCGAGTTGLGWPLPVGSGERDRLELPTGTVVDLAGNVREWTRDGWQPQGGDCWQAGVTIDPHCRIDDPLGAVSVRGGSWAETPLAVHAARRGYADATDQLGSIGFRCVREIGAQEPPPARPSVSSGWSLVSGLLPRDVQLYPSAFDATCRDGSTEQDPCPRVFVAGKEHRSGDPDGLFQPAAWELDAAAGALQNELRLDAPGGGEAVAIGFHFHGTTVVGSFAGTLTNGADASLTATSAGGEDGFVSIGFPGDAEPASLHSFGGSDDDRATALTRYSQQHVDAFDYPGGPIGSLWVSGSAHGIDRLFQRRNFTPQPDFGFATRLDFEGEMETHAFGGTNVTVQPSAVAEVIPAFGGTGTIVGGSVQGVVDFGNGAVSDAGSEDAFLLAFQEIGVSDATPIHSIVIGGSGSARIEAMVGYEGHVVAVGSFEGTMELSVDGTATSYESAGGRDAFVLLADMLVALEDPSGPDMPFIPGPGVQAVQVIGGTGDQVATDVAVNSQGAIVVVGSFEETISLSPLDPITSAGETDLFILGLIGSALEPKRWFRAGSAGVQRPTGVALTDTGVVIVAGEMENTLDLGSGVLDAATVSPPMPLVGFIAATDLLP
jgi:formylglycine-generating enzyme required for sulfatase activity